MINGKLHGIAAIAAAVLLGACSQKVDDGAAKDAADSAKGIANAAKDATADETPAGSIAVARIVLIDRATVLRDSAAGKHMTKQTEELALQMQEDFAPENKKLQADVEELQRQAAITAPGERQAKVAELESRRQAFQKKVQERQAAIEVGLAGARGNVEQALGPILQEIMTERGANLLLDRGLVVLGPTDADITADVVKRLDATLPSVPVTLTAKQP